MYQSVDLTPFGGNYTNPLEVLPGIWMFTSYNQVLQFSTGGQIEYTVYLSDIAVNQGLNDTLFSIPTN